MWKHSNLWFLFVFWTDTRCFSCVYSLPTFDSSPKNKRRHLISHWFPNCFLCIIKNVLGSSANWQSFIYQTQIPKNIVSFPIQVPSKEDILMLFSLIHSYPRGSCLRENMLLNHWYLKTQHVNCLCETVVFKKHYIYSTVKNEVGFFKFLESFTGKLCTVGSTIDWKMSQVYMFFFSGWDICTTHSWLL